MGLRPKLKEIEDRGGGVRLSECLRLQSQERDMRDDRMKLEPPLIKALPQAMGGEAFINYYLPKFHLPWIPLRKN